MNIAKAALIIMVGTLASRLLAVAREQVIAALFGASGLTDAFTAASRVPTSIYDLLIGGMISAALVPVFSDYSGGDASGDLRRIASTVMNFAGLALTLTTGILFLLAPQIISFVGNGYSEETQSIAITLLRVMLPSVFFMGLGGILTGLHYSQHSFKIPAICISLYNASVVVMALVFHETLGINSLVVGVLVGSFLQMAVQFWGMRGLRYSLVLDFSHPAIKKILKLYLPVALGLVVTNLGVAIDTNLASQTGEGSLAAMRFATTFTQLPLGLVAVAIGNAFLPSLSRSASAQDDSENKNGSEQLSKFKSTLSMGLRMTILGILPATIGLVVLREQVTQLVFEHGEFNADATSRTALAFLAYSPSLPAAAIDQLLIFAFYARKNTIVPVLVGVAGVGIYLLVALSLLGPLGMPGLALASSSQIVFHAVVMLLLLWRAIGGLRSFGLAQTSIKALAASFIMGAVCFLALSYAGPYLKQTFLHEALFVSTIIVLGFLTYITCLILFRVEETKLFWSMVRTRMGR